MFTNDQRQKERTGKYGSSRLQYLQELVAQFQNASDEEAKEKIVASLGNIAYDPYNYTFFRQLNILELFLDCLTEPNERLVEFAVGGICNACADPTNAAVVIQCDGIPLVIQCLSSPVKNTVNYAIGSLYYLCCETTEDEILKPEVVDAIKRFAAAGAVNVGFSNLAQAFLDSSEKNCIQPPKSQFSITNLSVSILLSELEMGVYLSTPKTGKASEDGENDRLRYGLSSMQGWRATMEDAHAAFTNLDDSTSFFGVYDGHGGNEVSKFCAKFLHQQVLNHEAYAAGDLETSVRKAFLRMDEMMCGKNGQKELDLLRGKVDQSTSNGENLRKTEDGHGSDISSSEEGTRSDYGGPSSGSTACVAILQNNQLLVANAGDSRCVMSRKGQAYELSKDHKPDHVAEKKRILDAGGYVQYGRVNGSLNLSRAIGDMELKQNRSLPAEKQIVTASPDIVKVELTEDDEFLILACDGIWDCMSSEQTVDFVKQQLNSEKKLSAVCEKVLERCLAPTSGQEGCDNMTMILVQFKKPLFSKPSPTEQPVPSVQ